MDEHCLRAFLEARYQKRDLSSHLDHESFCSLFREAVMDYFPSFIRRQAGVYGISFEIGTVVQKVYAENFRTYLYFNTESAYQEASEDGDPEQQAICRFDPWSGWSVVTAESPLFDRLQAYLEANTLYLCGSYVFCKDLPAETFKWYEENEISFDEAFEAESGAIRQWTAEVLGRLRREGFWAQQGCPELYVLPFGGECEISPEELAETYRIMDAGCHGSEYEDFLSYL